MSDTNTLTEVLKQRGNRYGKFIHHAEITQALKERLKSHAAQHGITFTNSQEEALDMICHKLGRIVNGDPNYRDSWVDIADYAQLVADELEGVIR